MAGVLLYIVCVFGYLTVYKDQLVTAESANKTFDGNQVSTHSGGMNLEYVLTKLDKMEDSYQHKYYEMQEHLKASWVKLQTFVQETNQRMEDRIHTMEMEKALIQHQYYEIQDQLKVDVQAKLAQETIQRMDDRIKAMETENLQLKQDITNLKDKMKLENSFIAFSAYAIETRDYNQDDRVLFPGVINNYGGHYNPDTSSFTCPYSGYYLFSLNVLSVPNYYMGAMITVNDTPLFRVFGDGTTSGDYSQASNFIIILCEQGSEVSIECYNIGGRMYGSTTDIHSTFIGFLLQHLVP